MERFGEEKHDESKFKAGSAGAPYGGRSGCVAHIRPESTGASSRRTIAGAAANAAAPSDVSAPGANNGTARRPEPQPEIGAGLLKGQVLVSRFVFAI